MFVRMLTVHCDQNNSYEITINGFQVRKINEIRNVIFGLRYGKPSSADTENYVSYFVYFSDLKTIYSYFITIILITINSQHSYILTVSPFMYVLCKWYNHVIFSFTATFSPCFQKTLDSYLPFSQETS